MDRSRPHRESRPVSRSERGDTNPGVDRFRKTSFFGRSVCQERLGADARIEVFPTIEKCEFDKEKEAKDITTKFLNELQGSTGGSPGREEVIDEHDFFMGKDRISVDFHLRLTIFERIGGTIRFPGEFSLFADRDKTDAKAICDGGTKNETACIDAHDLVGFFHSDPGDEFIYGEPEEIPVPKYGGDVFEENPRLREICYVADRGLQLGEVFLIHSARSTEKGDGQESFARN